MRRLSRITLLMGIVASLSAGVTSSAAVLPLVAVTEPHAAGLWMEGHFAAASRAIERAVTHGNATIPERAATWNTAMLLQSTVIHRAAHRLDAAIAAADEALASAHLVAARADPTGALAARFWNATTMRLGRGRMRTNRSAASNDPAGNWHGQARLDEETVFLALSAQAGTGGLADGAGGLWCRAVAARAALLQDAGRWTAAESLLLPCALPAVVSEPLVAFQTPLPAGHSASAMLLAGGLWRTGRWRAAVLLQLAVLHAALQHEASLSNTTHDNTALMPGEDDHSPAVMRGSLTVPVAAACLALADSLRQLGNAAGPTLLYRCARSRARAALLSQGRGGDVLWDGAALPDGVEPGDASRLVTAVDATVRKREHRAAMVLEGVNPRRQVVPGLPVGAGMRWIGHTASGTPSLPSPPGTTAPRTAGSGPWSVLLRLAAEGEALLELQRTSLVSGAGALGEPPCLGPWVRATAGWFAEGSEGSRSSSGSLRTSPRNNNDNRSSSKEVDDWLRARSLWWRAAAAAEAGHPEQAAVLLRQVEATMQRVVARTTTTTTSSSNSSSGSRGRSVGNHPVGAGDTSTRHSSSSPAVWRARMAMARGSAWLQAHQPHRALLQFTRAHEELRAVLEAEDEAATQRHPLWVHIRLLEGLALASNGSAASGVSAVEEAATAARQCCGGRSSPLHATAVGAAALLRAEAEEKALLTADLCAPEDGEVVCGVRVRRAAAKRGLPAVTKAVRRWRAVEAGWRAGSADLANLRRRHAWMTFTAYETRDMSPLELGLLSLVAERDEASSTTSSLFLQAVEAVSSVKAAHGEEAEALQYAEAALSVLMQRVQAVAEAGAMDEEDDEEEEEEEDEEQQEQQQQALLSNNSSANTTDTQRGAPTASLALLLQPLLPPLLQSTSSSSSSSAVSGRHRLANWLENRTAPSTNDPALPFTPSSSSSSVAAARARARRVLLLQQQQQPDHSLPPSSSLLEVKEAAERRQEAVGEAPFCHAARVSDAESLYILLQLRSDDARRAGAHSAVASASALASASLDGHHYADASNGMHRSQHSSLPVLVTPQHHHEEEDDEDEVVDNRSDPAPALVAALALSVRNDGLAMLDSMRPPPRPDADEIGRGGKLYREWVEWMRDADAAAAAAGLQ